MANSLFQVQLLADKFCERHSLSFFDEPLNLATNLVLVGAAVALIRIALVERRSAAVPASMQLLIGLVFLMALGSIVFHGWPSPSSEALDRTAVHAFVLFFCACFLRWMLGWSWGRALLLLPLVIALVVALRLGLPAHLAAPVAMLPALVACAAFAGALARRDDPRWRNMVAAGIAFAVALVFHRMDLPLCHVLPTGTHFLWHLFSGITVYIGVAMVLRQAIGSTAEPLLDGRAAAPGVVAGER